MQESPSATLNFPLILSQLPKLLPHMAMIRVEIIGELLIQPSVFSYKKNKKNEMYGLNLTSYTMVTSYSIYCITFSGFFDKVTETILELTCSMMLQHGKFKM